MQINKSIRSKDKDVNAYIEGLEEALSSYDGQNVKNLFRSINNIAGVIASDLDLIARGETERPDGTEVKLSPEMFDYFLKIVDKADKIKNFSDVISSLEKAQEEIKEGEEHSEPKSKGKKGLSPDSNPFEQMQNKVTGKNG